MSMIQELFGDDIFAKSLAEAKDKIKALPQARREKRAYLLKEFAAITGILLKTEDYRDVDC